MFTCIDNRKTGERKLHFEGHIIRPHPQQRGSITRVWCTDEASSDVLAASDARRYTAKYRGITKEDVAWHCFETGPRLFRAVTSPTVDRF